MQNTKIILAVKIESFIGKILIAIIFLLNTLIVGYTLEPPRYVLFYGT